MNRAPLLSTTERAERAAIWAARLADGPLSRDHQAEFETWLEVDPAHGEALREIRGAWEAVEHYAASAEVMALREAALASARRTMGRRAGRGPRMRLIWGIAASLVLLLGAVSAAAWLWLTPRTYETGVGERRVVALSDGSKLSLDADTVVRVSYTHENRKLWLDRGRARFEVAKNPLRPFSVTAGDEVVVATGTAFSVELLQKQVHVVLYEGHVVLMDRRGEGVRRTVAIGPRTVLAEQLLVPGQELIVPARAAPIAAAAVPAVVAPSDPARSLSWEGGQMVFEDESLPAVVERMNRYAERPLAIGDAGAAQLKVSGVFRAGDTNALVQGLAAAFGIRTRPGPDGLMLFRSETSRPPA